MSTEYKQMPYTTDKDIDRADEMGLMGWTQVVTGTRTVLFERTCDADPTVYADTETKE